MAKKTLHSAAAASYAKALLDLANGQNQAQDIGQELSQIVEVLDAEPAFESLLSNPSIGTNGRKPVLQHAFEGKLNHLLWNFVRLLNEKGRLSLLRHVAAAYATLLDEQSGKIEVGVTVAQRLGDDQLEQVRQAVSGALQRDAVVEQHVDESIIGGLVLRVRDRLIDSSVRAQLAAIKQQMLAARPKPAAATI